MEFEKKKNSLVALLRCISFILIIIAVLINSGKTVFSYISSPQILTNNYTSAMYRHHRQNVFVLVLRYIVLILSRIGYNYRIIIGNFLGIAKYFIFLRCVYSLRQIREQGISNYVYEIISLYLFRLIFNLKLKSNNSNVFLIYTKIKTIFFF